MRALVYEAPEVMNLRELDLPVPGPDEALLRVSYSGICGSELSGYLGQNSLRTPPLVFGHELAGVVEKVGPDSRETVEAGARVTVNPLVSCGRCTYCVNARQHLCRRRRLLGASLPGSNAEYVAVPIRAIEPVPDGLSLRDASMAEPAACAVHAVTLSGIRPSDSALVVGAGPIGLFLIQVLRAHGVKEVLATDRNPQRRRMAADAGAVLVRHTGDFLADVTQLTGGAGVAVSFDAAGTEATRRNCLASTAPGGTVMFIGLHVDETRLRVNALIRDEIAARGVFAYSPADFRTALAWLAEGRLTLRDGVVEAALEDGQKWYRRLINGDPTAKVLLRPDGAVTQEPAGNAGGRRS
jgi:threonine dehydrogenase-like Zn-dependent dehydrogenase